MTGLLFAAAIVAALAGLGWRSFRGRGARRGLPGLSPEHAISIQRFDEIEDWVRRTPCRDGSRPRIVSEGSMSIQGKSYRVVHVECDGCADEFSLYFDQSGLLN
ncbi:MAG: hypothetical protein AAFX94_21110 [Myxococcota bacterium]